MAREENIKIFEDTAEQLKTDPVLVEALQESLKGQKLVTEEMAVTAFNRDRYAEEADVVISKKRSLAAAAAYKGQKTAVLNFASATHPGGGVVSGAGSQEECICRCSGLYFCLNTEEMQKGFYGPHKKARDPLHNDDIIYTPGVTVFKSDTASPALLPKEEWYPVNVITCAAPNLRQNPGGEGLLVDDRTLLKIHEKRLTRILDVAAAEGNEVVILGAFGCGVFRNDPDIVARAARNVLRDYLHVFRTIEYALYCSPRNERNYRAFERVLKGYL